MNVPSEKKQEAKKIELADMRKKIYLQRQTRVINDLFNIFLSAECQKLYKALVKLQINEQGKIERLVLPNEKLNVALGQVVQLCIHFGQALSLVLKNTMIYNGSRSSIHSEETLGHRLPPNPLYVVRKADQTMLEEALRLLEENLTKVYRALKLLKSRENIGFVNHIQVDEEEGFTYPNRIIRLLHKIADF